MAAGVGLGLMVASQVFQGVSENNAQRAGARADDENARLTELQGNYDVDAIRRNERATQGEAIAAEAANGVQLGTGSALDLLRQNSVEAEYKVLSRRYEAAGQASSLRAQASQKRAAGRSALFGGLLRAGASALTGIDQMNTAKGEAADNVRVRAAQMPGGQRLPIPASLGGY